MTAIEKARNLARELERTVEAAEVLLEAAELERDDARLALDDARLALESHDRMWQLAAKALELDADAPPAVLVPMIAELASAKALAAEMTRPVCGAPGPAAGDLCHLPPDHDPARQPHECERVLRTVVRWEVRGQFASTIVGDGRTT